ASGGAEGRVKTGVWGPMRAAQHAMGGAASGWKRLRRPGDTSFRECDAFHGFTHSSRSLYSAKVPCSSHFRRDRMPAQRNPHATLTPAVGAQTPGWKQEWGPRPMTGDCK